MTNETPRFSVVMTVYDNAPELENHLPAYLEQQVDGGCEVVIVDESSADSTDDVLKLQKATHPNLYTTFLPKPNRQVVRLRLALTIGVKAAKGEWLVFTDINNPPPSPEWLADLAEFATGTTRLALGYIKRKTGDVRLQLFDDPERARFIVRKTERRHARGHSGRMLRYQRGKYDFILVRADEAHHVLSFFEQDVRGRKLLGLRLRVMGYNLFH